LTLGSGGEGGSAGCASSNGERGRKGGRESWRKDRLDGARRVLGIGIDRKRKGELLRILVEEEEGMFVLRPRVSGENEKKTKQSASFPVKGEITLAPEEGKRRGIWITTSVWVEKGRSGGYRSHRARGEDG